MRFNPPPNWPPPPEGWTPPADWAPDPSWPPPPDGWKLFLDDEPVEPETAEPEPEPEVEREQISRPQSVGDVGEYFGTDRAWSDASDEPPVIEETALPPASAPPPVSAPPPIPAPVEVLPDRLSIEHVGRVAMVRWEDARRYEIGTVAGVSADSSGITLHLKDSGAVPFLREQSPGGPTNPRLYVWL